jgi:hypothetical protein
MSWQMSILGVGVLGRSGLWWTLARAGATPPRPERPRPRAGATPTRAGATPTRAGATPTRAGATP